ncbi:MAG TPA: phage terminase large subunit [Puia sp.]
MQATIVFQKNWDAIHATNPDGSRRYKYIINTGSSRSSKTGSLIQVCDLYARKYGNKRITAWRDTKKDCKDTVLNDALNYFKMWGTYLFGQSYNKTESIFTYTATDSTFEIHGTDDEEKVMGMNKAVAWLNEPYKISRETFDQIDQRTEDFVLIDWNPKKSHWITDLQLDPRAITIHSTFRDNPFCPDEQRRKILSYQPVKMCYLVVEKKLTEPDAKAYDLAVNPFGFQDKHIKELTRCRENEAKRSANDFNWSVYGLGLKGEKPNRILKWESISPEQYNSINTAIYAGIDWGTVDPWGILEAKYYDGCMYYHELNYASENEIRAKLTTSELHQINSEEEGIVTWRLNRIGLNKKTLIICDNNRPDKISALRRHGWNAMPAHKGAGSVNDGIDLLNNLKGVYYTSSSTNLEYEQENYSWQTDRHGVVMEDPEDMDNHLIDPARYIAQHLQAIGVIKRV